MRYMIITFIIILIQSICYSYTAKINITTAAKEIKIQADYSIDVDNIEINLPKRAILVALSSPSNGNIRLNNNSGPIILNGIQYNYKGKIALSYTLPVYDIEFYKEDWLPVLNEDGNIRANITVPQGYRGLFIPYAGRDKDGFDLKPGDKPLLICGKYKLEETSLNNRNYSVYYPFQLNSGIEAIDSLIGTIESMLTPLTQKNFEFIMLPALQHFYKLTGSTVFIAVNDTSIPEIKRALLYVWFKEILKQNDKWSFALGDLFCRILDDSGKMREDAAYLVPVPPYEYYRNIIQSGFPLSGIKKSELYCNVNDMLKNFAILHFAYYTIGMSPFLDRIKIFSDSAINNQTNLRDQFLNDPAFNNPELNHLIGFIFDSLLPVADFVPDVSVKGKYAYRNNDNIPDIKVQAAGEKKFVSWNNKRMIDIGDNKGLTFINPDYALPQLNFYNDKNLSDPVDSAEWKMVSFAISQHKHYEGESYREILDLEKFIAQTGNIYGIPEGSTVYTAVIKIIAPVNGKLMLALKEVILMIKDGKPMIIADRIRI